MLNIHSEVSAELSFSLLLLIRTQFKYGKMFIWLFFFSRLYFGSLETLNENEKGKKIRCCFSFTWNKV